MALFRQITRFFPERRSLSAEGPGNLTKNYTAQSAHVNGAVLP